MNWKQIFDAATPTERDEIMYLLFHRPTRPKLAKISRRRARVHWLGRADRPRRRERALFMMAFVGSMLLLESDQFLMWSIVWGGTFAMFINLYTAYRLIPRKRAHWVRRS